MIPAPATVHSAGIDPFLLTSRARIAGDPDAASVLTHLLDALLGETFPIADEGEIALTVDGTGAAESYRLSVDAAGVTVVGADSAGLFYGVQTLAQLVERTADGVRIPAVRIDDAPRFPYRGVMLDVARHCFDVPTVKAVIDRAALLKLNHLHLHLTDDQGWRLHLDSRPELTARGAGTAVGGDPGGFYTKDDYREIVAYAASRHITTVPEIDLPGHTHALGLAYPDVAHDPVVTPDVLAHGERAGEQPPRRGEPYEGTAVGFSSLRIHDDATYDLLRDVLGELAALTPGPYLHIGGDEAHGTDPADFAVFIERASAIVAEYGKTVVAWHEAGAAPGLARGSVGQYWGFVVPLDGMDAKARAFADGGARVILSPADAVYLDMKYDAETRIGLEWANGPTSVRRSYEWEPAEVIPGLPESAILGVEAPLWTETVRTLADIDELAFPRLASAAEAAWSPATGSSELRTWESFRERVAAQGELWTALGIAFHRSPEIPWPESR
ncbi:hexosaminidase [Diaminobutyricimonas aerilata]|uniref:beta-N-acetylhexosaminidase n=1 Tax=Diaminobutyricimonas aerilata TaxID=1162967 RepID=A0A2M9CEZ3_9MICO|nr:family 20 glycosylhydrolase [Diaminobutyricimonas aerilata]PJJ70494.1 hexosaminidase [Diaminobutyricimonas aerilata]